MTNFQGRLTNFVGRLYRRSRLRLLLFLLGRLSRHPRTELLEETQRGLGVPPEVLLRTQQELYSKETEVIDLALRYRIALEHDPVVRDLYARLYEMQKDLGQAILQGRRDEWGNDLTDGYRKAFGMVEYLIALPGALQVRRAEIEEATYGLPPEKVDTTENAPNI